MVDGVEDSTDKTEDEIGDVSIFDEYGVVYVAGFPHVMLTIPLGPTPVIPQK